jgi:precorrin-3B methylase
MDFFFSLSLQISSDLLLDLDALKERLKISGSESLVIVALNYLDENCRTILQRFGEDLKKNKHWKFCHLKVTF